MNNKIFHTITGILFHRLSPSVSIDVARVEAMKWRFNDLRQGQYILNITYFNPTYTTKDNKIEITNHYIISKIYKTIADIEKEMNQIKGKQLTLRKIYNKIKDHYSTG